MAVETFDQRFKRLTSDLLMLDICRTLGIEVRELMKIRSGTRVPLTMDRLRRLCQEQGLDFASFTRDYHAPWSNELKPTQVITSDQPAPTRTSEIEARSPNSGKFREDGSRIVEGGMPSGRKSNAIPTRLSELAIVSSEDPLPLVPISDVGIGMVGRIKAAVAGAAARLGVEPLPEPGDDLIFNDRQDSHNYPEPRKIGATSWGDGDHASIQTILSEVTDLRREVSTLSARINTLIGR